MEKQELKKFIERAKNHNYDGVNLKVVWETITEDLPALAEQLRKIVQ